MIRVKDIDFHHTNLIGLSGHAGAGKSTIAEAIRRANPDTLLTQTPVRVISFASPLKRMLNQLLIDAGLTDTERKMVLYGGGKEVPITPLGGRTSRHLMQTLGTEWGRELVDPNLWVSLTMREVASARKLGYAVVIDDVRFGTEVTAIRAAGGLVYQVERPGVRRSSTHKSEELPAADETLLNDIDLS